MTTIERPRSSAARTAGAPNLKRYLIALLAGLYVVAWWAFGVRAPAVSADVTPVDPVREPRARRQQVAAWYQDLPPSARPRVQLPAGWHIAERTAALAQAVAPTVPIPQRAAPARPGRIRTRSS